MFDWLKCFRKYRIPEKVGKTELFEEASYHKFKMATPPPFSGLIFLNFLVQEINIPRAVGATLSEGFSS